MRETRADSTRLPRGIAFSVMDGFASYEGNSGFLRWWPKILLGLALWLAVDRT